MKKIAARHLLPMLAATMLLTHCSCDLAGTAGALLISESDEMQLGKDFDNHLRTNDTARAQYPLFKPRAGHPEDVDFVNYVTNLGQEIVDSIPADDKPSYPFTFTILDTDIVNAFAVPGGYVYVYTGLIKQMRDESELAGVLGHEISHITQHHYRDAMAKDAAFSLLLQALVGNDSNQIVQLVAGSFYQLVALKGSRANEADADYYGTIKEGWVKRNPMGIAKFFKRMPDQGIAWLSTHPEPTDRQGSVTDEVNADVTLKALAADSAVTNYQARFQQGARAILLRP